MTLPERSTCKSTYLATIALTIALLVTMLPEFTHAKVVPLSRASMTRATAFANSSTGGISDRQADTMLTFGHFESSLEASASATAGAGTADASQSSDLIVDQGTLDSLYASGFANCAATALEPWERAASGGALSSFQLNFRIESDSVDVHVALAVTAFGGPSGSDVHGDGLGQVLLRGPMSETVFFHSADSEDGTPTLNDELEMRLGPGDYSLTAICQGNSYLDYYTGGASGGAGFEVSMEFIEIMRVTVLDGAGIPIKNTTLQVTSVINDPPIFTETNFDTVDTDSTGRFELPDQIQPGDTIKISKLIHEQPAVKHQALLGTVYSLTVDNAKFDSLGAMSYFIIPDSTKHHEIVLDHTTIKGNLVVSIEWDAKEPYLQTTEAGFRSMANYLYDVTDGQFQIDTVAIFDNGENWTDADVRVYASNMEWPRATPFGWKQAAGFFNPTAVFLPRRWFGNSDLTRNGAFTSDPLDMSVAMDYRTRGHELGHYMFGFRDEYEFALNTTRCANVANYGYMDTHYESGGVLSSEMSNQEIYQSSVTCLNTNQWTTHGMSCWFFLKNQYEKRYTADSIFVPILQPFGRDLFGGNTHFPGPNDNVATPDYDVGAQVVFSNTQSPPSAETYTLMVWNASSGNRVSRANVTDFKPLAFPPRAVNQGQTDDNGFVKLLGVNATDVIYSSGYRVQSFPKSVRRLPSPDRTWLFGEANIGQSGVSRLGNEFKNPNDGNLELTLKSPAGDFAFVARLSLGATTAELGLDAANPFPQLPTLDQNPDGGTTQNYAFAAVANGYQAPIDNDLAGTGELKIWAVDDSAAAFFVDMHYKTAPMNASAGGNEIFAYDGSARASFDLAGPMPDRAAILTSRYLVPRNGLQIENLQAGEAQTLALQPEMTIGADSRISIRYSESDLGDVITAQTLEGSLRIFGWNATALSWNLIGGSVDTAFNEVTANITQEGVYAAFTTEASSSTPCGDADSDGTVNVSDVVFLVSFIFSGGPAPLTYASGDANCDGSINVSDCVYLIEYIFTHGAAPCAACH